MFQPLKWMTPRFSGSSIFTNILAIIPILFLTLNLYLKNIGRDRGNTTNQSQFSLGIKIWEATVV